MLHEKSSGPAQRQEKLSEVECEQFAEACVDKILDFSTPWVRTSILAGLESPETLKEFGRRMGFSGHPFDASFIRDLRDALNKLDRQKLLELVKTEFRNNPPAKEAMQGFLASDLVALMRKGLEEAAHMIPSKRGRKPKARQEQYPQIAMRADELYPVCLKVLTELESQTQRSVRKLFELWKQDFPGACTFLLRHIAQFESALKDKRLRKRAIRLESRARLLADAMAGAEYGLTPRTSIERARQGRRMMPLVRT